MVAIYTMPLVTLSTLEAEYCLFVCFYFAKMKGQIALEYSEVMQRGQACVMGAPQKTCSGPQKSLPF